MNITDSQKKYALMLLAVAGALLLITKRSKAAENSTAYTPNPNNGGNGTTPNYPPSNNNNPIYPPQTPGPWTPPYVPPNNNTQQQGSGNSSDSGVTDHRLRIAQAIKLMSSTSATKPVAYGQTAEYWFNQINQLTLMEIYTLETFWAEVSNDTQDVSVSGGVKGSYGGVEVGGNAGTTVTINQSMTLYDALNSFDCNDGGWFDWWDYGLTCQTKRKALERVK